MAHAREEVADMASIASSLVLNIGTLTTEFVDAMLLAGKSANEKKIPVVLDVCGAGATRFRDEKSLEILDTVVLASSKATHPRSPASPERMFGPGGLMLQILKLTCWRWLNLWLKRGTALWSSPARTILWPIRREQYGCITATP